MKYSLILVLISLLVLSCQREPRKSPAGYTTLGLIQQAEDRAEAKLNPYSIQAGQRVHKVETQEVVSTSGSGKILSKEWTTDVTEVENTPEIRYITTFKKVNDKVLDENFFYEFKNVYPLQQISNLSLQDQLNQNAYSANSIVEQLKDSDKVNEADIDAVAFQNLESREVNVVPPELVKSAENCKGIPDCRVKADLITYDIVFRMNDGSSQRHKIELLISWEVPFFASVLKQCATTVLPVDNARVLVKQCREVVDFDK